MEREEETAESDWLSLLLLLLQPCIRSDNDFFLERAILNDRLSDLKGTLDVVFDYIASKDLSSSWNVCQK